MHARIPLILLGSCLAAAPTATAEEGTGGAVVFQNVATDLEFEDGSESRRRFRRAGVEYWEPVAGVVRMGFGFGYSESEGREPSRPLEAVNGNYASLGVRFDIAVTGSVALLGRVTVLYEYDRHTTPDFEFETRLRETRAELGPALDYRQVQFRLGASWRDLGYRDTIRRDAGDTVSHADAVKQGGGFAAVGLRTDPTGLIALRYDKGADEGWTLRFERTF